MKVANSLAGPPFPVLVTQGPRSAFHQRLGDDGLRLWRLAQGRDDRAVHAERETKSVSSETTFDRDISDKAELTRILLAQCDRVATRLRREATEKFGDAERWPELTKSLPFGRAGHPEEIASMTAFLASDLSGYTSGTVITIDGGLANKPG